MDGSGYGNPERGWNDPPKLAFCPKGSGTPAGAGRHRLLNKRVPIPINSPAGTTQSPQPPSLKASGCPPPKSGIPMVPPPVAPCPPPSMTCSVPSAGGSPAAGGPDDAVATQKLLEQVRASLFDSLKAVSGKLKESTQEEIRKRLDVMVDMWQKEQLSAEVQSRMHSLTQALSKQDYDTAWAMHQSLIVDYTTSCSPWMVGIKTLIAESRSHSEATPQQDKPTDESNEKSGVEEDPALDGDTEHSVSDAPSIK